MSRRMACQFHPREFAALRNTVDMRFADSLSELQEGEDASSRDISWEIAALRDGSRQEIARRPMR
jgi:hypothetical protein